MLRRIIPRVWGTEWISLTTSRIEVELQEFFWGGGGGGIDKG